MKDTKETPRRELSIPCLYHGQTGKINTEKTLEVAAKRAEELDIHSVLVASTSGKSGLMAAKLMTERKVIVVTHSTGFAKPDHQQLLPELREQIEEAGAQILTCQHAFGGVGRAVRKKVGTYELDEIMAFTLRTFGEGTKVAIEIALMAADAGLVSTQNPCISVGGTAEGVDAALVLIPANAQNFFDLKVLEILAKPRLY
ncbi:pyruvate kinase alpha/beta domain-containing protein [Acidobacteriota bacterium]